MRVGFAGGVVAVLVLLLVIVGYGSLFTVYQTKQALVIRLGNPVRVVSDPGLHLKYPLIDTVISIDKRILDLESPPQEVIASDQKRLVVDAFARYRIEDPLKFYQTVSTIEGARSRLSMIKLQPSLPIETASNIIPAEVRCSITDRSQWRRSGRSRSPSMT